jgi:mono/diheme cytochrome c family protein
MSPNQRSMVAGAGMFAALLIVLAVLAVVSGFYNFGADSPHTAVVQSVIELARDRSVEAHAGGLKIPKLNDEGMIADGASHYAGMCTQCHLAPGLKENEMRPGMNPKPPILADFPADDPAEQFWIVKHGIKMSGMPAWGTTHTDAEIWEIVAFLQNLHGMTPEKYHALIKAAPHPEEEEMGDMDMGH